jgi:hypothetical protein
VGERERGKFPSQPVPNPKGQFVIGSTSAPSYGQKHVQAITTLRSGRQVDNQVAMPKETIEAAKDEENYDKTERDLGPHTVVPTAKESPQKFVPKAPFPERLTAPKKGSKFEDVPIKVDKFYYPVDFIVLDTKPVMNVEIQIPVILGRPFLATTNALINYRTEVMKLSFGNMTVELNFLILAGSHLTMRGQKWMRNKRDSGRNCQRDKY